MLHCVFLARVLALTGDLHFPTILSACLRVPATLKIAASRAVQRRGSGRQTGRTCPIVHERSVSNFWFEVWSSPRESVTRNGGIKRQSYTRCDTLRTASAPAPDRTAGTAASRPQTRRYGLPRRCSA